MPNDTKKLIAKLRLLEAILGVNEDKDSCFYCFYKGHCQLLRYQAIPCNTKRYQEHLNTNLTMRIFLIGIVKITQNTTVKYQNIEVIKVGFYFQNGRNNYSESV